MSEVNNAIVIQTCAKIASEIINNLEYQPENVEQGLEDFAQAFHKVYDIIQGKIEQTTPVKGRKIPVVSITEQAEKLRQIQNARFESENPRAATAVQTNSWAVHTSPPASSGQPIKFEAGKISGVLPISPFKAD